MPRRIAPNLMAHILMAPNLVGSGLILPAAVYSAPAHAQIAGGLRLEGVETCAQLSAFIARNPRFDSAMIAGKREDLGGCVPAPVARPQPRPAAPARPAPTPRVTLARPTPTVPRVAAAPVPTPAPEPRPIAPRPVVPSITPRLNAPSLTPRLNAMPVLAAPNPGNAPDTAPEVVAPTSVATPPEVLDLSLGQEYLRAAQGGDVRAMGKVAELYRTGAGGLGRHPDAAVEWAKQADAHGDPWGRYILGLCFEAGDGELAQDPDEAYRLFHLAAEAGIAPAMGKVGEYLYQGWGRVPRDDREALRWLDRAADTGDARANYYLALFHLDGLAGLEPDPHTAAALMLTSAQAGDVRAMFRTGRNYEIGIGIGRDLFEARRWYRQAAEAGDPDARQRLDVIGG